MEAWQCLMARRLVEVGPYAQRQLFIYNSDEAVHQVRTRTGMNVDLDTIGIATEVAYNYNAAGALVFTSFKDLEFNGNQVGAEIRGYDISGRLAQIQRPEWTNAPFRETLAYTPGGRIASTAFDWSQSGDYPGSGQTGAAAARSTSTSYSYDGVGRLQSALFYANGVRAPLYDVTGLTYDPNGNLTGLQRWGPTPTGSAAMLADALTYNYTPGTNRLASVADATTSSATWGMMWDADPTEMTYRADGAAQQIMTFPVPGTTYGGTDPVGVWSAVALDDQGKPTHTQLQVLDESQAPESYPVSTVDEYMSYDGAGLRVRRTVATSTTVDRTFTVRDGMAVVGEFDGTTGELRWWATAAGREDWAPGATSGTRVVYRRDHLGTVRSVQKASGPVGARGGVVEARDYYPFGLQMPGRTYMSGTPTREGFTGHELDAETGLNYAAARYYMPALGRFLSTDRRSDKYPHMSPYSYGLNDPTRFTDVTGDTVDVREVFSVLENAVYASGHELAGEPKSFEDMNGAEKQAFLFWEYWNSGGREELAAFHIGGEFESTNITVSFADRAPGAPRLFGLYEKRGTMVSYGLTTFGDRSEPVYNHDSGIRPSYPETDISNIDFNIYLNPGDVRGRGEPSTARHEMGHVRYITGQFLKNERIENGFSQHSSVFDSAGHPTGMPTVQELIRMSRSR